MTSFLAFAWGKVGPTDPTAAASNNIDEQDLSPDVSESSSGETLTNQASEDSLFERLGSPETPEGFRPRKSVNDIRRDLNLTVKRLDWHSQPIEQSVPTGCSFLPPIFNCGSMPSPQVSTSSFYTRSSYSTQNVAESPNLKSGRAKTAVGALIAMADNSVAESPNLKVGQAKTAVGSLVAMAEARVSFHESTKDSSGANEPNSILPPRHWLDDSANDISVELPYEALNDSKSHSSPMKKSKFQMGHSLTASDDESSVHASPSSNNWRNAFAAKKQQPDTSFTHGFMNPATNVSREQYDFHPINNELIVAESANDDELNMSGISQSTKDLESLQSLADEDENDQDGFYRTIRTEEEHFRDNLRRDQIKRERRSKEDLVLSTFERLQDDPELVLETMEALKEGAGHSEMSLRFDEESLVTGFSREKRAILCQQLERILHELRETPQEEHNDLQQALSFCHSLVHIAAPSSEKPAKLQFSQAGMPQQGHRWKCVPGFRASLGFEEEPQSPETIRGGDSSLFSLPSASENETTPHTSNVSMTTTITSAFSPEKNNRQLGDGNVNLRRALETILNLFDQISAASVKLLDTMSNTPEESEIIAEEIKLAYLQLLTVSNDELEALIDSFELDLLPLKIGRLVSEDHGESGRAANYLSKPQPFLGSSGTIGPAQRLVSQTMGIPLASLQVNVVEDEEGKAANLFSPSTEDMNSIEQSTNSVDDLRRTVGSFDRENVEEEREAAPPYAPGHVDKKPKSKRGIWKRRMSRKRQAME